MKQRKILPLIGFLFIAAAFLAGNDMPAAWAEDGVCRKINAEEAKRIMEGQTDYILLDVRTYSEFIEKRINGALSLPGNEIAARAALLLPDKDGLIIIYCRSGRRSALAARELARMGYTNLHDLGGIINWPYLTVSGEPDAR